MSDDKPIDRDAMRTVASAIQMMLPDGLGFLLLVFDYGADGHTAYVSTAQRDSAIALLEELMVKLKGGDRPATNVPRRRRH